LTELHQEGPHLLLTHNAFVTTKQICPQRCRCIFLATTFIVVLDNLLLTISDSQK